MYAHTSPMNSNSSNISADVLKDFLEVYNTLAANFETYLKSRENDVTVEPWKFVQKTPKFMVVRVRGLRCLESRAVERSFAGLPPWAAVSYAVGMYEDKISMDENSKQTLQFISVTVTRNREEKITKDAKDAKGTKGEKSKEEGTSVFTAIVFALLLVLLAVLVHHLWHTLNFEETPNLLNTATGASGLQSPMASHRH